MLQIQDTLVSLNVIERRFCCDVAVCRGACCVEGDSGAPLTGEEINLIEDEYDNFKGYMRKEGIEEVERQGHWIIDVENDQVTPLIKEKECAYAIFENGLAQCAIEKAYFDGKTRFRKPISCHLYPVRIKEYKQFIAVNYDEWDICRPAKKLGEKKGSRVYEFVREALINRFGEEWYQELELAAEVLESQKNNT